MSLHRINVPAGLGDADDDFRAKCTNNATADASCWLNGGANRTQATTYARNAVQDNANLMASYELALHDWNLNAAHPENRGPKPQPPPLAPTDVQTWLDFLNAGGNGTLTTQGVLPGDVNRMSSIWGMPGGVGTGNYEPVVAYHNVYTQTPTPTPVSPAPAAPLTPAAPPRSAPASAPAPSPGTSFQLPSRIQDVPNWISSQPWYVPAAIVMAVFFITRGHR